VLRVFVLALKGRQVQENLDPMVKGCKILARIRGILKEGRRKKEERSKDSWWGIQTHSQL
jgi:hypothetical protein